jgi:rRNA maturation endonuclease Nob1
MAEVDEEESSPVAVDVLCPLCETLVSVVPGDECPNCGAALEVASG